MALTPEERQKGIAERKWSFPPVVTRVDLIRLGGFDGKTFADAIIYADTYGNGFDNKTKIEKQRIAKLVENGSGGVLNAILAGTPPIHTQLSEASIDVLQFEICLYLQKDGNSLADSIIGAKSVVASNLKKEAVLYFLWCGKTLAAAKAAAGVT